MSVSRDGLDFEIENSLSEEPQLEELPIVQTVRRYAKDEEVVSSGKVHGRKFEYTDSDMGGVSECKQQ